MILVIGEILFDIFPGYKRMGGAPFNFAFHLKNLGVPVRFITRIGNDIEGKEILRNLRQHLFKIDDIQIDEQHKTGKVMIELDDRGNPEFNILSNVAYDYIAFDRLTASVLDNSIDLIYFGSLAQRNTYSCKTIQKILLQKHQNTKCLCDINLRPQCFGSAVIIESLKKSDVLKLNEEELEIIKQILGFKKNAHGFIEFLLKEYSLDMISLTKGEKGSDIFTKEGRFSTKPRKINNMVDTVGAGDAYTAILAIGYLNKWNPVRILSTATEFAARICEIKGAVPKEKQFYANFKTLMNEQFNEKK